MIKPNYLELKATDAAETRAFYAAALGFSFVDYGPGYFAVEGGAVELGFAEPAVPLPTLETTDLGKSLAAVRAAGGAIVKEPFSYPGGRRFEFLDPSGNRLAVYQRA